MYYIGFCPVCETGPLGIRICGGQGDAVILCDECDAVWLSVDCAEAPIFPEQPDLLCPICAGTLREPPAHWATADELAYLGWKDAILGEGEALGEGGGAVADDVVAGDRDDSGKRDDSGTRDEPGGDA